jgi:hypothetical protein
MKLERNDLLDLLRAIDIAVAMLCEGRDEDKPFPLVRSLRRLHAALGECPPCELVPFAEYRDLKPVVIEAIQAHYAADSMGVQDALLRAEKMIGGGE